MPDLADLSAPERIELEEEISQFSSNLYPDLEHGFTAYFDEEERLILATENELNEEARFHIVNQLQIRYADYVNEIEINEGEEGAELLEILQAPDHMVDEMLIEVLGPDEPHLLGELPLQMALGNPFGYFKGAGG